MNKWETSSCTAGVFHFISNIESFIRFISRLVLNGSAPGHSARAVRVLMGNRNTPQVPVCGDKLPPCETKRRWCSHSLLPLLQSAIGLLIILAFNSIQPPSLILSEVIREAGSRAGPVLMWTLQMRRVIFYTIMGLPWANRMLIFLINMRASAACFWFRRVCSSLPLNLKGFPTYPRRAFNYLLIVGQWDSDLISSLFKDSDVAVYTGNVQKYKSNRTPWFLDILFVGTSF